MADAPAPAPQGDAPVGQGLPIVLAPHTFDRHESAARYVETLPRNRAPYQNTSLGPGACWVIKVQTPSGGIPAATSNSQPSFATCTIASWNGTSWVAGTDTISVGNPSTGGAVTGSRFITATWVSGIWEANLDPC